MSTAGSVSAQLSAFRVRYGTHGAAERPQPDLGVVPTVSSFFGVRVRMYFDDHAPAHFHAYYGESMVRIAIETLEVIDGNLPRRALALVVEWAFARRNELRHNWHRARRHEPLVPIAPLE